jgi:hypothetical protein
VHKVGNLQVSVGIVIPDPANPAYPFVLATDKRSPSILVSSTAPSIATTPGVVYFLEVINRNAAHAVEVEFEPTIGGSLLVFSDGITGPRTATVPRYTGRAHREFVRVAYSGGGTGRERIVLRRLQYKQHGTPTMGAPHPLPPLIVEMDL